MRTENKDFIVLPNYYIPTSWKEHDNGIATYNRYGNNIGDDVFSAPYYGDGKESQDRRYEKHMAYMFAHNGTDLDDTHNRIAWESMINDPRKSAHDFVHSDEDAVFVRGSKFALNEDDMWTDINAPKKYVKDKQLERALEAADTRPLHHKDSLNRVL